MESSPENLVNINNPAEPLPTRKFSKKFWIIFVLIDIVILFIVFYIFANSA